MGHTLRRIQRQEKANLSNQRRSIGCTFLSLALVLLTGCGGKPTLPPVPPEKPPLQLRVEVAAAPDANRNPGGKPLSVVVRLYELKSQGVFAKADFFSLYDREGEVLGGDLIARDEITLAPGQFLPIARPLNPEATYLGVIAAFREIDQARWRDLMRLKPGMDNTLLVEVGANAVSIRHR